MSVFHKRFYSPVCVTALALFIGGLSCSALADGFRDLVNMNEDMHDAYDESLNTGIVDDSGNMYEDAASALGAMRYQGNDGVGSSEFSDSYSQENAFSYNGENVDVIFATNKGKLDAAALARLGSAARIIANRGEGVREKGSVNGLNYKVVDVNGDKQIEFENGMKIYQGEGSDGEPLWVVYGDMSGETSLQNSAQNNSSGSYSGTGDGANYSSSSSSYSGQSSLINSVAAKHVNLITGTLLGTPVSACMNSPYGWRFHPVLGYDKIHRGIDLASGCGDPIYAAESGVVETVVTECGDGSSQSCGSGYGNHVVINHTTSTNTKVAQQQISTLYGHMPYGGPVVTAGQRINKGDLIGYVGTTGISTGCHLHFEVFPAGYSSAYAAEDEAYDPAELVAVDPC